MHSHHAAALDRAISPDRFGTNLRAGNGGNGRARELYIWDRDVAAAVLADVAIVEVALRNTMNDALVTMHGADWYTKDIGLDDRSRGKLARAWQDLRRRCEIHPSWSTGTSGTRVIPELDRGRVPRRG